MFHGVGFPFKQHFSMCPSFPIHHTYSTVFHSFVSFSFVYALLTSSVLSPSINFAALSLASYAFPALIIFVRSSASLIALLLSLEDVVLCIIWDFSSLSTSAKLQCLAFLCSRLT